MVQTDVRVSMTSPTLALISSPSARTRERPSTFPARAASPTNFIFAATGATMGAGQV